MLRKYIYIYKNNSKATQHSTLQLYVYLHAYIYTHTYTRTHIHTYTYLRINFETLLQKFWSCSYIIICMHMYIYMYIHIYVYVYTHILTHVYIYIYTHQFLNTYLVFTGYFYWEHIYSIVVGGHIYSSIRDTYISSSYEMKLFIRHIRCSSY